MGKILRKTSCDSCGSSNNRCEYDDGSTWCFTPNCESNKRAFKNKVEEESNVISFDSLPFGTSADRNISVKVCEMFGVKREVSSTGGTSAVYYPSMRITLW